MDRRVTVVIPAFDPEPRLLRMAVNSALNQTLPGIQVVVVDDGSRHPLDWLITECGGRITVVRKDNGGPASARNMGIRLARGSFIAFLDADDAWLPTKAATQVEALQKNPAAGLCYTRVQLLDMDDNVVGQSPTQGRYSGQVFPHLFRHNFVASSSVMVTREALGRTGEFHEGREVFAVEDYDLWLRIAEHHELVYLQEPLALYRLSPTGISRDVARSFRNERNVVERAVQRNSSTFQAGVRGAVYRRRVAQIHRECGAAFLYNRQTRQARAEFWSSVRKWPFTPSVWASLGISLLGDGGVQSLRQLRRALRRPDRA